MARPLPTLLCLALAAAAVNPLSLAMRTIPDGTGRGWPGSGGANAGLQARGVPARRTAAAEPRR